MTKAQWLDLAERAFWTFVQSFVAVLLASNVLAGGVSTDVEAWKVALIAAAIAGVKAVIAQQFGNGTAATVPAADEPVLPTVADDYGTDH